MARTNAASFAGLTTNDGRRPRVAIVGGNASAAMVATMLAEQFGCAPLAAADDAAIMALFGEDAGIDLVLADISAVGTGGLIVTELVRALGRSRALPVLALIEADGERANGDFAATVRKPYSPRELFSAMREALAHRPAKPQVGHA